MQSTGRADTHHDVKIEIEIVLIYNNKLYIYEERNITFL